MNASGNLGPSRLLSKTHIYLRLRPVAVSMALVVPCLWRPIVSGIDLQSHLYNAWLADQITRGGMHGLWIGHQSTNILVDMLLPRLLRSFGPSVAERVASAALVLVFFWGAFRFISAVRGQAAYWLAPWLAMLSYGFVFQMGFLNYYLACGIVFWVFSFLWRESFGWRALGAAPLLLLSYLAHPLPVLWLIGVGAYYLLARQLRARLQLFLLIGGVETLFLIRGHILAKYFVLSEPWQLTCWTGADQFLLYGCRYLPAALGFLLFGVVILCAPENRRRAIVSVPAQVYALTAVAVMLIPWAIGTSKETAAASYMSERLSFLCGVLLLAVLSRSTYRRWYLPVGLLAAAAFFAALYCDIGKESRVEAKIESLVETLPAGARVVWFEALGNREEPGHVPAPEGNLAYMANRVSSVCCGRLPEIDTHLLSRACLGHCFDYMNYEPSTGQFRIHAAPGNPVVLATYVEFSSMRSGIYVVGANDLPLYALIQCGPDRGDLFIQPMAQGESGATLVCPGARGRQ